MKKTLLLVCIMLTPAAAGYAAPADGHEDASLPSTPNSQEAGIADGWLHGYPDGTYRLGKIISRAEFLALLNRAFGLTDAAPLSYPDLAPADWYYADFAIAAAAGYVCGFEDGTMRPSGTVTRGDAALMAARLLHLDLTDEDVSAFKDASAIPGAQRGAAAALFKLGIVSADTEGRFNPAEPLTRAGAAAMIRAASKTGIVGDKNIRAAGSYGPESGVQTLYGTITISAPGVLLRNMNVHGSLILSNAIGEGDVDLDHVRVSGQTIVHSGGSGSHGLTLQKSAIGQMFIDKPDGIIRIAVSGETTIEEVTLRSQAIIDLDEPASIGHLILYAPAAVQGQGQVVHATFNEGSQGSSFAARPGLVDGPQADALHAAESPPEYVDIKPEPMLLPTTFGPLTRGEPFAGSLDKLPDAAGTVTYDVVCGALPPGTEVTSDGDFSGTPTLAGTYTFEVRATDGLSHTADHSYTVTVTA
ncbi:S-layer homology domain-containing protein [Paenibacillus sp. R14(2021)]|uniref:S-layer homology domain-containing protein n=1 Tax=Paenibacillus sp. R14(2021) TaxID=2859228 RepID=UPI001C612482|nr:S-layer homology domain-containing protein [Paenibacillus sp. R14(2021)]